MKIRWHNVIGLPLGIVALSYGLTQRRHINVFFESLGPGNPGHFPAGQVSLGFLALVCLLLGITILIKIFLYQRNTP